MILLFVFLSVFIGLNIRYSYLIYVLLGILFLIYIFIKYKKRLTLFCFLIISISVGVSFVNFSFEQETYSGIVIEAKDNYFIFSSKLERLYVYEKEHTYEIGDNLSLKGNKSELSFTILESDFDFKAYLNKKGVYSSLNVEETKVNYLVPIRLRTYKNSILSNYSSDTATLIKSIFGGGGESEIKSDISYLHLSRLLSLSGVYLYIILKVLTYLLTLLIKEKWAKLISLFLLSPFLIFSFPKFAVIKVFMIVVLRWINDYLLKKRFSNLSLTSFLAIIFLIFDYHNAYQDAFVMGFFLPIILHYVNNSFSLRSRWKKYLLRTFTVLLFIIPFEIKFYDSINLLAYPLQLIISPLFVIYGLCSIFVFFNIPMVSMMNGYTTFLGDIISFLKPAAIIINIPYLGSGSILFFEIIVLILLYYMSIRFKAVYSYFSVFLICLSFMYIVPVGNQFTSEVCFINVGQGDATLIRKGKSVALIDTGGSIYKDIANDVLIPYLRKKRIYNIDLLITTHDDNDHSGAVTNLIDNFKVKKYITSYKAFPISFDGIDLVNYNVYQSLWNEENDRSLVIGFNLFSQSFLITGDAPKEIENQIIKDNPKLKVDILKVGHHGSNTSTSENFINSIQPKKAIISVGKNNYGHPHSSVLSILKKHNVEIVRTDQSGTVVFS